MTASLTTLTRAVKRKSFGGWHNLGRLEFERGDNAAALEALREADRLEPGDYSNRLYLGWTLLRLDRREDARRVLEWPERPAPPSRWSFSVGWSSGAIGSSWR